MDHDFIYGDLATFANPFGHNFIQIRNEVPRRVTGAIPICKIEHGCP